MAKIYQLGQSISLFYRMRTGSAIWNNGGDTAYLRDADGTMIIIISIISS
jgi:hypothetical protein